MSFDALLNAGEYLSAHYLADVLPKDLKRTRLIAWAAGEKAKTGSPRASLRGVRSDFFAARAVLAEDDDQATLHALHARHAHAPGHDGARRMRQDQPPEPASNH